MKTIQINFVSFVYFSFVNVISMLIIRNFLFIILCDTVSVVKLVKDLCLLYHVFTFNVR